MERNKTIMKLCYLQTTFYIVFLTALITRHRRGISQKTFAFLIILSLVGCAVSLTLGDYLRNMIRSSGFDVAGVHDKKSLEKKLQQLQNADDTLNAVSYTHPAWIGAEYSSAPAETRWRDFARSQTHHRRIWQENYPQ